MMLPIRRNGYAKLSQGRYHHFRVFALKSVQEHNTCLRRHLCRKHQGPVCNAFASRHAHCVCKWAFEWLDGFYRSRLDHDADNLWTTR